MKPAARVSDMHVCPMLTPGIPPIPHVGGPVLPPGAPTVLIGGLPAATVGGQCLCVGPPDAILMGSATVLIQGKPAARMGDSTAHGGSIVMGCPTVMIGGLTGLSPGQNSMYVTFEVTSANAASLGPARRKVFTVDGGRIGRAPENDMVLPGVGVHRHHATVRFINGVFFVEGVGTNGIAVNNPEVVLPRNEPYPLKTGDKVFIDEFEVAVTTSATAPAEPAAARPPERAPPRPLAESTGPGRSGSAPLLGVSGEAAEDLDPLRKLTGGASAAPRPRAPVESSWNHSSSLSDHFAPPPAATVPGPASSANVIPENWDRTSFDRSKLQPQGPSGLHSPARPPAPPPTSRQPVPPPARGALPTSDWHNFLVAAHVDPERVPPETAAMLGNIMRSVVQGLIEVLRARSEIKPSFACPSPR